MFAIARSSARNSLPSIGALWNQILLSRGLLLFTALSLCLLVGVMWLRTCKERKRSSIRRANWQDVTAEPVAITSVCGPGTTASFLALVVEASARCVPVAIE